MAGWVVSNWDVRDLLEIESMSTEYAEEKPKQIRRIQPFLECDELGE
jgi:hypothetical protein